MCCTSKDMSDSYMPGRVCHRLVCAMCRILQIRWAAATAATALHPAVWRASCAPAALHRGPPPHLCRVRKRWDEQLLMYVFLCGVACERHCGLWHGPRT